MRSLRHAPAAFLALALARVPCAQEASVPFPPDAPEAQGVDPAALARLEGLVQGFVERDEVVGAELLVIQRGRTVLHGAYGWRDREEQRPMEPNTLFCVRSMTKPLVGTAIQMLLEEGKLEPSSRLGELWPAFDVETTRGITVEHLLTHTSGFPLSLLLDQDLKQLEGIEHVALLGTKAELEFTPGERFGYSDQNSDTLAALVGRLGGMPVETFLRERILAPLGMTDTVTVMREGEPLRARTASSYGGARGGWARFWSPADPPLFPFFLGSQGLYSTPMDYARFRDLWVHKGRADAGRLLAPRFVRHALEPAVPTIGVVSGFEALETWYGQQWEVWQRRTEDGALEVVGFGHSGSDGTWAWAFPDRDLMAFYFTQSRGNVTGMELERELERSFLGASTPEPVAPALEPLIGLYHDARQDRYVALLERDGGLWFEAPGAALLELRYVGGERWKFRLDPSSSIGFERGAGGEVTTLVMRAAGQDFPAVRLTPDPGLPSAADVEALVREAHGLERLAQLGAVRISGKFAAPKLGRSGKLSLLLASGGRFRQDVEVGGERESNVVDGGRVFTVSAREGPTELDGPRAAQARLGAWTCRFGDWSAAARVRVLYRSDLDGEPVLVTRLEPEGGNAVTRYVSETTGRVLQEDMVLLALRLGELGVRTRFSGWREEGGLTLPLHMEQEFASPLVGTATFDFESVETGVELAADAFTLAPAPVEQD